MTLRAWPEQVTRRSGVAYANGSRAPRRATTGHRDTSRTRLHLDAPISLDCQCVEWRSGATAEVEREARSKEVELPVSSTVTHQTLRIPQLTNRHASRGIRRTRRQVSRSAACGQESSARLSKVIKGLAAGEFAADSTPMSPWTCSDGPSTHRCRSASRSSAQARTHVPPSSLPALCAAVGVGRLRS